MLLPKVIHNLFAIWHVHGLPLSRRKRRQLACLGLDDDGAFDDRGFVYWPFMPWNSGISPPKSFQNPLKLPQIVGF